MSATLTQQFHPAAEGETTDPYHPGPIDLAAVSRPFPHLPEDVAPFSEYSQDIHDW
ncbi:hypothetical protein V3N95_11545 (plasmid) [Micrococcaceae bacterium Sec6.3]